MSNFFTSAFEIKPVRPAVKPDCFAKASKSRLGGAGALIWCILSAWYLRHFLPFSSIFC